MSRTESSEQSHNQTFFNPVYNIALGWIMHLWTVIETVEVTRGPKLTREEDQKRLKWLWCAEKFK